jgi:hypothetical protein
MANNFSVGSRREAGYPILKHREDGRTVVASVYVTLKAAQDVADVLNDYAHMEAPVVKKPKEEK